MLRKRKRCNFEIITSKMQVKNIDDLTNYRQPNYVCQRTRVYQNEDYVFSRLSADNFVASVPINVRMHSIQKYQLFFG